MSQPDPYIYPLTSVQPAYLYGWDQTNPMLWSAANPDAGVSVSRLSGLLWQGWNTLQWYDAYYEGDQPLSYMSKAMQQEMNSLLRPVVLNWPRLVVDAYAARMTVEGFRYAGSEDTDDELWAVWQANKLDKLFRQALVEMMILGRSYVIVGSPDMPGGEPVVTVESPFQVAAIRDPRTRRVTEAVKLWTDLEHRRHATLYQANRTVTMRADGQHWVPIEVDDHMLGVVPVVPLVNRARLLRPNGVSEFHDVIPIVDAAIKNATDMMIAAEYHAMPRRWIFGLKKDDFKDQNGNPTRSMWSTVAGRIWSSETKDVNVGQFTEASLTNFHETIKLLAQLASQVAALPANYLAFNNVNPTSADAMRAIDAQLELRIKGKMIDNGEDAEDIMRLVKRFRDGFWAPEAMALETVWADPGTPTVAQKADAVSKLVGAGIIPIEQAREDLGYGPIVRARMAAMDEARANDPIMQALAKGLTAPPQPQLPAAPTPTPMMTTSANT